MSSSYRCIGRTLTVAVISLCAAAAQAQVTVTARTSGRVAIEKIHPDLIEVEVKKADGTPVADGTKVTVERIDGDAMLFKTATVLGTDAELKTTAGRASVSVAMRKQPRAEFLVTVADPADATKIVKRSLTVNALDDIPSGRRLACFTALNDDAQSPEPWLDCREDDTYFTFYSGYAVNNFAVPELKGNKGGTATSSDIIAGLDFGHALFRRDPKVARGKRGRGELWVYGETLHGVASTNNCTPADNDPDTPDTCEDDDDDPTDTLVGVIEDATTLEAYAGFRYEFQLFPILDDTGSRLYAKGQVGFISILGKGVDLIDNHHGGLGIVKVHGRFTDSYFEAGYGRNDLFKVRNNGRWKVDALVTMNMRWPDSAMVRPFIQLTADTDFGSGADNVQTFFGLDFDLTLLRIFSVRGRD
jgi:hypothetical protein